MGNPIKPYGLLALGFALSLTLTACQNQQKETPPEKVQSQTATDTVDSTVFAKSDTMGKSIRVRAEYIPSSHFGYYRTYTPSSILLDEKGEKTMMNGSPVQVPASVSYIQLKAGRVYGVQLAQGQQFLFTGFYDYSTESSEQKGTLNLALEGRYLKTGKPVGPWSPKIRYMKSGSEYALTLIGVSGAPDSPLSYVAAEIPTARMQELMRDEESKLK